MRAHLLLAHSAQALAQPESRVYLLVVPAKPLLGACPGVAGWAPAAGGSPVAALPSFITSLNCCPVTEPSPPDILCYRALLPPHLPTCPPTHLPLLVRPLLAEWVPFIGCFSPSGRPRLSPLSSTWPSSSSSAPDTVQLQVSPITGSVPTPSFVLSPPEASARARHDFPSSVSAERILSLQVAPPPPVWALTYHSQLPVSRGPPNGLPPAFLAAPLASLPSHFCPSGTFLIQGPVPSLVSVFQSPKALPSFSPAGPDFGPLFLLSCPPHGFYFLFQSPALSTEHAPSAILWAPQVQRI